MVRTISASHFAASTAAACANVVEVLPSPSAASREGFSAFDDRLLEGQPGFVVAVAPKELHGGLVAHVVRRLRALGWSALTATARPGAPLFREVATHAGLGALSTDPATCAEAIAAAALRQRAAIVVGLPADGSWDLEVAAELAQISGVFVVFVAAATMPSRFGWTTYELGAGLTRDDRLRWFSAAAEDVRDVDVDGLGALERWWQDARRRVGDAAPRHAGDLPRGARELFVILALVGRSIPLAVLADRAEDLGVLVRAGHAVASATHASLSLDADTSDVDALAEPAARVAAAEVLVGTGFEPCPWSFARAAELLLAAGELDAADQMMEKAARTLDDARAADELSARWHGALATVGGEAGFTLRLRAVERALAAGDAYEAERWCDDLSASHPGRPEVGLVTGRTLLLLGDLVASRLALSRAMNAGAGGELRARIAAALAEVAYAAGDLRQASEHAAFALSAGRAAPTRLEARNILGKILLAGGQWREADEHFAEDALSAFEVGDVVAELRARVNRAISMMSSGRLDDARVVLDKVLDESAKKGEDRARSFALRNLAVIAYRQHDYGRALEHWETAVRSPAALCGRITTVFTLANLADLRLRLGLVDHAEHTLAFARRMIGGQIAAATLANLGIVSAKLALQRRDVTRARREIDAAIASAEAAGDRGDRLPEAYLVAARVSLEEGDVGAALELADRTQSHATNDRLRAEVAIVRALRHRAAGQPALDAAKQALALARAADEEDLLAEVHALLAAVHRDAGDRCAAETHCRSAMTIRDRVATGLSPEIRAAYLAKPEIVALSRLASALAGDDERAPAKEEEEGVASRASTSPSPPPPVRELVGDDPRIRSLLVAVRKVARSSSTVLVRGESGTGKELVAAALHRESPRASGPLVSVNCAALVETLLLSELFGHEKGAFTGAAARRRGRFEMAEGGTLFLDEIGDISPRTQVALLRVLQEKCFERVGGAVPIRVDVRIVCATHRDLKAMVERGEFREDLYYRLQGVTLEVPALRERLRDLPKLAEHLLERIALERADAPRRLTSEAVDLLMRHRWPGNVRELENVLRASSVFADGDCITVADLVENVPELRALAQSGPASMRSNLVATGPSPSPAEEAVDDPVVPPPPIDLAYAHVRRGASSLAELKRRLEQECIARALAETGGNITRAAALLGMKRPRLSQLAKQYGFSTPVDAHEHDDTDGAPEERADAREEEECE